MFDLTFSPPYRRILVFVAAVGLVLTGIGGFSVLDVVGAPIAVADSSPANPNDPKTPPTVTADALPTVQIDGVAWSQVVVGNTVYVGGSFTTARPAGAAAGQQTTPRTNMLAYDIRTGTLLGFSHKFNGQIRALTKSPDGTRVYAAGDFSQVDDQWQMHVVAFDTTTGNRIAAFSPSLAANALSIAVTNSTVYIGGDFGQVAPTVGGAMVPRVKLAAFNAANGAVLPFRADVAGPYSNTRVQALALTLDGSKLIVAGLFTSLGGSPARSMGWVNATTGAPSVFPVTANLVNNSTGRYAAINSLSVDSTGIYATGQVAATASGNMEGVFRTDAAGNLVWIADCKGDTYSTFLTDKVVYISSHEHNCTAIGGFTDVPVPDNPEEPHHFATAMTKAATGVGVMPTNPYGWEALYVGKPAPSLLNWFPRLYAGTYTGQGQAGWNVTGNADYVVYSGEFPLVNGVAQQGLVRFATHGLAPKLQGPRLAGAAWGTLARAELATGQQFTIPANWDRDNTTLTYKLYRDSESNAPVWTGTVDSTFYSRPQVVALDTCATVGSHVYRLTATDPDGNIARTDWITANVTRPGPNQPPTASFTASAAQLVVTVDGSASRDPDGTIASYAWTFGDGGTATGAKATHTYATAGTYTVTLIVTDNAGSTGRATTSVSATATPVTKLTGTATCTTAGIAALTGTATAGHLIQIRTLPSWTVMATATANAAGQWSASNVAGLCAPGATNNVLLEEATGGQRVATLTITASQAAVPLTATVTSRVAATGAISLTGTAGAGHLIQIRDAAWNIVTKVNADASGKWSASNVVGLVPAGQAGQIIVEEAFAGKQVAVLTINVAK